MTFKYLCGVDYQHEMEEGLADFFDTVPELKTAKKCWQHCGIVRILLDQAGNEVSHKWVVEQDLFRNDQEQTEESDPQNQS